MSSSCLGRHRDHTSLHAADGGIDRSPVVYAGAAARTRTAGVMRARIFDRMGASLVGKRTVSLPRAAKAAAKAHRAS